MECSKREQAKLAFLGISVVIGHNESLIFCLSLAPPACPPSASHIRAVSQGRMGRLLSAVRTFLLFCFAAPFSQLQCPNSWKWQPTPVFLPGESHGRRSMVGYSPWVAKSWTRLSDFHSRLSLLSEYHARTSHALSPWVFKSWI